MILFAITPPSGVAQGTILKAIEAKFPATKATADRTDIVTAGAVMDLKVDGLLMFAVDAQSKAQVIYKDGKLQPTTTTKMNMACIMNRGPGCAIVRRTFVAGEKIWLIDVAMQNDGIQLTFLSDAIKDVRYMTALKFPSPKGSNLSADEAIGQISQVITPEPVADSPTQSAQPAPTQQPAAVAPPMADIPPPPPPPMADIPPPPPPADAAAAPSKGVAVGQTMDEVIANYGQPTGGTFKGATKTTLIYEHMKVIVIKNKVSDVIPQ
jgi:hypothetical protein